MTNMTKLDGFGRTLTTAAFVAAFGMSAAFAQEITLNFVGTDAPASKEAVIAAFEAKNPGIKINYESVPFKDLNSIIQSRVGAGDPDPDIYMADQPRIAALVKRGMLLDLSPFVGELDGIIQSSIDASTVNGKLFALPISTSSQLTFYNKALLDAASIPHPSREPAERMTWEEMRANGEKAQASGAEFGFMWDQINRYYQLQPLAESAGGGSGIGPGELDIDVTNDGWLKAMRFYASAFEDGLAPRGVQPGQTKDVFATGKIAYFVGGPWWMGVFNKAENLDYGIAPHPYFEGGEEVTPTGAWSWGVNPNSDNIEAAVAFIKFAALDPEGALETAKGFGLPPANEATFDAYYSQNQKVEGVAELIRSELANTSRIRPRTTGYVEFETFMGKAFEDIRNGADPAEALATAEKAISRAWSRN